MTSIRLYWDEKDDAGVTRMIRVYATYLIASKMREYYHLPTNIWTTPNPSFQIKNDVIIYVILMTYDFFLFCNTCDIGHKQSTAPVPIHFNSLNIWLQLDIWWIISLIYSPCVCKHNQALLILIVWIYLYDTLTMYSRYYAIVVSFYRKNEMRTLIKHS